MLKDAQAFKERKAKREADYKEAQQEEIKLGNIKNEARGHGSPPPRDGSQKPAHKNLGVTSPTTLARHSNNVNIQKQLIEDEKTDEEKAEEKKKVDMMRKFYRNRHSSFLQALSQ